MRLRELEKLKTKYPQLEEVLYKYEDYLFELFAKPITPDIYPETVAKRLSITEARAIVLLDSLVDSRLLTPWYLVNCPNTGFFLHEYSIIKDIPSEIDCPADSKLHDIDDCEISLVFRFTEFFRKQYQNALVIA